MAGQTSRGAWISFRSGEIDSVVVHSSEIKALREAVRTGGATVFVQHEQSLNDAVAGRNGAEPGRLPGEEPLPELDGEPKPTKKRAPRTPAADPA